MRRGGRASRHDAARPVGSTTSRQWPLGGGLTDRVGFGLVGCGRIGRWHARGLVELSEAKLAAVTDENPEALSAFARRFEAAPCPSLDDLLRRSDVEVVVVATPPASHAAIGHAAAAAGKHVLVEKPLALSVAVADRLIEACESAGVTLGVVHQQRTRSAVRAAHELVRTGRLGRLVLAVGVHAWCRTPDELETDPWRGQVEEGGGMLLDQAVHLVDLLVWILGGPAWVSGSVSTQGEGRSARDPAGAVLGFPDGSVASVAATTSANSMRDDICLELYGSRGSLRLEIRDYDHAEIAWLDLSRSEGRRARRLPRTRVEDLVREQQGEWRDGPTGWVGRLVMPFADRDRGGRPFRSPRAYLRRWLDRRAQSESGQLQGHPAVLRRMAAAVRGEGEPIATGKDARAGLAVIEAWLRSSAEEGRSMRVDVT